jgi:hypothetical protein
MICSEDARHDSNFIRDAPASAEVVGVCHRLSVD